VRLSAHHNSPFMFHGNVHDVGACYSQNARHS
jgi:hypothetical protein